MNRAYAMPEFKKFAGQTEAARKLEVEEAAAELFSSTQSGGASRAPSSSLASSPAPQTSSACLYERWQQEKAEQEQAWFAQKYRLESQYTAALTEYVEAEQERANVEAELSPLREQLKALDKQITYKKGQLDRARERLEFSQKNYRTRFASVPWSMVVVGCVPIGPDQKIEVLKEQLALHMRQEAGKELIPGRVQGFTDLQGERIRTFLSETHTSTSAIIDSYDQESQKMIGTQTMLVQLHRIEARPKLQEGSSEGGSTPQSPPAGMQIFAWREGRLEPLAPASGGHQLPQTLKLDDAEQGYLRDKEESAKSVNQIGVQILTKWEQDFQTEQRDLDEKRDVVQKALTRLEADRAAKQKELTGKERRLAELRSDALSRKERASTERQAYELHYKKRIVLQNRLVSGGAISSGTQLEYIRRLAQNTWPSQEQRSGLDSSQILIRQNEAGPSGSEEGAADVQLKMSSIQYRAQVVGFKILYLALYEPSSPAYVLNIAYEIEQTEGPAISVDPQQKRVTIDTTPRQVWRWHTPQGTSLTSSGRPPAGYTLPSLNQLQALAQFLQENGPDALEKLQFDLKLPFVSREKTRAGKYRTVRLPEGQEGEACDELDEINLLWVPEAP